MDMVNQAYVDETIVDQGVSRYGLHTIKILRLSNPVDKERWLKAILENGADKDKLTYLAWYEDEVDIHYLQIWWRVPGDGRAYDGWIR